MGIPIELPSSPAPRSRPCHSAKPSWSSSAQHFQSPSSSSSTSSSSSFTSLSSSSSAGYSNPFPVVPPALSLARQQLLQDTRPPLTSLAYHPPPLSHSQSLTSQQRTLSSHSSSVYGSYHSFPSPSSLQGNNGPSVDQSTWIQQVQADFPAASVSASTTAAVAEETEIQSPSPTRAARPHPNLRRISRVPVFMASPSGSGSSSGAGSGSTGMTNTFSVRSAPVASTSISTFNNDYYSSAMVRGATVPTAATSNMDSIMMSGSPPPASQPRPIWHPSSPSLVHYLTRPLPPLPRPSSTSTTSSTSHTVEPYPHQLQPFRQEQQEQPLLPQELVSWNYRFVNMNHADNHNRPEAVTLGGGGSGMMHGYYYEDDRLRHDHSPIMRSYHQQQHYYSAGSLSTGGGTATAVTMTGMTGATASVNANITAFSSSSASLLAPRPRHYNSMRGGSEGTGADDIDEEEWILQQQQQQQQLLSERHSRHRPTLASRERELQLQRERQSEQQLHHHHLHHGQTTLSPTPLLSPSSPSSPSHSSHSSQGSSDSSSSSTLMTPVPSFLQGHPTVARTLIRADAFQQGVIHIYPENHAPIRMYGRPILTPTSPPLHAHPSLSSPSPLTPRSSHAATAATLPFVLTDSNDYVASVIDQGHDNELTVHIPARPLATPPSSAGSSSPATTLSSPPSPILLSPIPSLPPPAVTTATTILLTQVSQEISETTSSTSSASVLTSRSDGEGVTTPLLARPPSAALSPVLTSGELYRFSSSSASSISSSSSAGAFSGSPQTLSSPSSSSMSLTLLRPSTMQASRPQSVALSAEEEEAEEEDDAGKEGFEELPDIETHRQHQQHYRADHGARLLSGDPDRDQQQDQPPVHPLEQFP